jgi:N,N-dimethylformamidase
MAAGCELGGAGALAELQDERMDLVGYTDRLDATPSDTVKFMVSSDVGAYDVEIVELIHGDRSPSGPGFKMRSAIPVFEEGLEGQHHDLPKGSYVVAPAGAATDLANGLTVAAWIYPTSFGPEHQSILWLSGRSGLALTLTPGGALAVRLGGGDVTSDRPLTTNEWHFVGATYSPGAGVAIWQSRKIPRPLETSPSWEQLPISGPGQLEPGTFVIGAGSDGAQATPETARWHFNGKIATPRIYGCVVTRDDLEALSADRPPDAIAARCLAAWDFGSQPDTTDVVDRSPSARHGLAVNCPMRAVTSWRYDGGGASFASEPQQYDAIMFHADDLDDARWPVAFELTVPEALRSGVYAAHLTARTGTAEDYVPFFVGPSPEGPRSPIAVLLPTFSYLAYADEHYTLQNPASPVQHQVTDYMTNEDRYALESELLSLYDFHRDGVGNAYVSLLRPLTNMRPDYRMPLVRAPHQFPADLHLIDWLNTAGFSFDVLTDHTLDTVGADLLTGHQVVLTGSHPEYWTRAMWTAMETYLAGGGRVMYLGGNGMYWVVSRGPGRSHIIELRRGHGGTGAWRSQPGEEFAGFTGERGGLWRHRGKTPQSLFGVGMTAAGYDRALPYARTSDSHDPRAAFIFEGVPDDAIIGDTGLVLGGAAGLEIDRADFTLGTPAHALIVASATGFSDSYQAVVEEVTHSDSKQGGTVSPLVRADMTYFEGMQGGAVFAVGSMTWTACLSANNYDNHVARITHNVLSAFCDPGWEPVPQRRPG